jgi:hypothetical protein
MQWLGMLGMTQAPTSCNPDLTFWQHCLVLLMVDPKVMLCSNSAIIIHNALWTCASQLPIYSHFKQCSPLAARYSIASWPIKTLETQCAQAQQQAAALACHRGHITSLGCADLIASNRSTSRSSEPCQRGYPAASPRRWWMPAALCHSHAARSSEPIQSTARWVPAQENTWAGTPG